MAIFNGDSYEVGFHTGVFSGQRPQSTFEGQQPQGGNSGQQQPQQFLFDGEKLPIPRGPFNGTGPANVFATGEEVGGRQREDQGIFEGGSLYPPGVVVGGGLAHVSTFASKWNTVSKSYRWTWDEAYGKCREDALAMRRDCYLQSLLYERSYPTSQMSWHLEPENKQDKEQVQAADYLTACIQSIPDWEDFLFTYQNEVLWAGRGGMQNVWDWKTVQGDNSYVPCEWIPTNGDKLQFTWNGIPEVMVYAPDASALKDQGAEIRMTDRWMVLVMSSPSWRDRWTIGKCFVRDADFFAPAEHGKIHGTGLRDAAYWGWWLRAEHESWGAEFVERVGAGGVTVYYYEAGNAKAKESAVKVAKQQGRNTWIVWPRQPGEAGASKGIERVEPSLSGADFILKILDYWDKRLERLFIGQSMSGGADNESGLGGSGRAKFAKSTKQYILTSDAKKRAGELTRDLVGPLQRYNCRGVKAQIKFVFDIETDDPKEKLEAVNKAWTMGVSFDEDEVRALTGCKKPEADASILKNEQAGKAQGMSGQGAPGGDSTVSNGYSENGVFQGQPQGVFQGNGAAKDQASLFAGQPIPPVFEGRQQDLKNGPPVRNAKDSGGHGSDKRSHDAPSDEETKKARRAIAERHLASGGTLTASAAREFPDLQSGSQGKPDSFAGTVQKLLTSMPKTVTSPETRGARFGEKVFISHLFDAFKKEQPQATREDFNRQLLEAHQKGDLQLSRADLVEAMHPEDVKGSEVKHPSGMAEFHFVRPQKNAADDKPAKDSEPKKVYALGFRGESTPPLVAVLGIEKDVRKFFAWMKTQGPDLAQFAIDSSTNPAGDEEDVRAFAEALEDSMRSIDTKEGIGQHIYDMASSLLNAATEGKVLGVVVTSELPE